MSDKESVLVVDRVSVLGYLLRQRLEIGFRVIFISAKEKPKIPLIPDVKYAYIYFVFGNNKESKTLLSAFLKKANKDDSTLIILSDLRTHDQKVFEEALLYRKTRVIIFGDLYGLLLNDTTFINRFLDYAAKNKSIKVLNTGGTDLFPVEIDDCLDAIMTVSFKKDFLNKVFLAFGKHPVIELGLSRIIQKRYPQIGIDFVSGKEEKTPAIPHGEYFFDSDKKMEQKINKLFGEFLNQPSQQEEEKKNQKINPIAVRPIVLSLLFFIILTFFMPFLATFATLWFGKLTLFSAKTMIERGDFNLAKKNLITSREIFEISKSSSTVMLAWAQVFNLTSIAIPVVGDIDRMSDLSEGGDYAVSSVIAFEKVFKGMSSQSEKDFYDAVQSLRGAIRIFKKIQADQDFGVIEGKFFENLHLLDEVSDVSPALFGFEEKKTYLILFQNNMELRPGGGFVGSYGLVTFDKGKIADFSIHDVYDADGQLKGHIEPPYPIRRHLPSVHWYLRDCNFDLDFAKAVKECASLFYKETEIVVDGVLGVDVTLLKDLLSILGPLKVADYNETVTEKNVYLLTQTYAEKDFFPGSSAKKDFLRSLFNTILFEFLSKRNFSFIRLAETLFSAIEQKHIVFAVSNPKIQKILDINGVSSSLIKTREERQNKILDFFGINESNLGVNKVNYFIKRSVSQKVSIEESGKVVTDVAITYQNTSSKNTWPGGDYKNYLRVITPAGSRLLSVKIDGEEKRLTQAIVDPAIYEARNFSPPKELEVETVQKEMHTVFGFIVTVPIESHKTVSVTYERAYDIPLSDPSFSYDLIIFKQPGTEEYPFSFSLSYPKTFRALKNPELKEEFRRDLNIVIDFTKR